MVDGVEEREPAALVVLRCPELDAAPELLPLDTTARVLRWPRREVAGSLREQAAEGARTLDAAGVAECVVVSWSAGTAAALELARRYPRRVRGLLLLAGPPTAAVDALLDAMPAALRALLAAGGGASLALAGPLLESLTARLPVNGAVSRALQVAGLVGPDADLSTTTTGLRALLHRDWRWHVALTLARNASERPSAAGIGCPVTVLAGRHDVFADVASAAGAVSALPQARVRVVDAAHLIPFEAPDAVREELALLLHRVQAVECARRGVDPPRPPVRRIRLPLT